MEIIKLKNYFLKHNIIPSKIFCGQLSRQNQSAAILSSLQSNITKPQIDPAFNEIDYGQWEGLSQKEIMATWGSEYEAWTKKGAWPENIFLGKEKFHIQNLQHWLNNILQNENENNTHIRLDFTRFM